jgi:hypothetical protein
MIRDDILLAETLSDLLSADPEIEVMEQILRSAIFRFVPLDLGSKRTATDVEAYLDWLNRQISIHMGEASDLPVCERNLRGNLVLQIGVVDSVDGDTLVSGLPNLVAHAGHQLDAKMRCKTGSCV